MLFKELWLSKIKDNVQEIIELLILHIIVQYAMLCFAKHTFLYIINKVLIFLILLIIFYIHILCYID